MKYSPTGATMPAGDGAPRKYQLVSLPSAGNDPMKLGAVVFLVLFNGKPHKLLQRTNEGPAADLAAIYDDRQLPPYGTEVRQGVVVDPSP